MRNTKIIATGSYLPTHKLTNHMLEKMVDTSNEWIISRTGIKERRIIGKHETCTDMAYLAAIDAITSSQINTDSIDMIIVATSTPDKIFPSTACLLQHRLNLKQITAFDINAACSGFLYALSIADAYIKSNTIDTILVIGVDAVSHFIDYTDRNTCILFGDGAGAVILQKTTQEGIIYSEIHADGAGDKCLNVPGNIKNGKIIGNPFVHMNGRAVFKSAVQNLSQVAQNVLDKSQYSKNDIDWLIPHQANLRIIEATAETLSLSLEKVIITLDIHGNTAAASIPLALDSAIKNNKIKSNDLLLLEGFGAGFTWGASLIRY